MEYFINGKLDRGGIETDRRAKAYSQEHGCDYFSAVRAVIKEATQSHAQKINRATARYQQEQSDWRIYEDSTGSIIEVELRDGGQAIGKLSSVVAGLPKLADGTVDVQLALRVIRAEFSDLAKSAAGGYLHHQAKKIMGTSKPMDHMDLMTALQQAQANFPAVGATYNGAAMSEESLRTICFPLFRTTVEPAGPGERSYQRPSVKSYSADRSHISFDSAGNEIRRYDLVVDHRR